MGKTLKKEKQPIFGLHVCFAGSTRTSPWCLVLVASRVAGSRVAITILKVLPSSEFDEKRKGFLLALGFCGGDEFCAFFWVWDVVYFSNLMMFVLVDFNGASLAKEEKSSLFVVLKYKPP